MLYVNDRHMRNAPRISELTIMPLIREGLTVPQMAKRLGIIPRHIYSWCHNHHVNYKRIKNGSSRRPLLTAEALQDAADRGLTINQLAKELGMTRGYVSTRAYHFGIQLRGMKGSWKHPFPDLTPASPNEESPPSPAMLRLAEFDSIAARAVARKGGQSTPEKEPDPDEGEED